MQVALLLKSNNYKCSKIVRSYNSIEQPEFSYSTNQNITILEECLAESFKDGYTHFSWHRNLLYKYQKICPGMILLALVIIDQTWEVPNYHHWLIIHTVEWNSAIISMNVRNTMLNERSQT